MMESVLLDTDVFSFFFKKDSRRELYAHAVESRRPCLSSMSVAELKRWALVRKWGRRQRERLVQALRHYVILPCDDLMADRWAEISVLRERLGHPISCGDCWIAASALRYGIPLATHNGSHFAGIPGLIVICQRSSHA